MTLLDRQEAVRDLESRLRHALLIARLGGERLVSRDGRLEILRLVGHGASGVVCEALDHKLGRKVALKLYPGLAQDSLAKAVRTEAQVIAALKHRNIVVVHDFDAEEFRPGELRCFLVVMELLSGTTLRHWMAQPHPAGEILDVFCRAGDGLAAAHAREIVHRDFKPENVILDGDGEPKLVDFGLAILDTPAGQLDSKNPDQRAIVGTLAYMAPEALRGRADARSDQFSFAAALWEALCGEFPYRIDDVDPNKRVPSAAPKPGTGLPATLFDCLRRALQADPARRFSKMADLVARLRQLQDEVRDALSIASAPTIAVAVNMPSDVHGVAATAAAARRPSRSWGWLAFPAVGGAAVVGVLVKAGLWDTDALDPVVDESALIEPVPIAAPLPEVPAQAPFPAPSQAVATSPPVFSCPDESVRGLWLFKSSGELYALDLSLRDRKKCQFAATLTTSRPKPDEQANGSVTIEAFPPLLGSGIGRFRSGAYSYDFFFAFEEGQLRGHVKVVGGGPARSSLIRGGRKDSDRRVPVASDQPCAALCVQCNGLQDLDRCRKACGGERSAHPQCGPA